MIRYKGSNTSTEVTGTRKFSPVVSDSIPTISDHRLAFLANPTMARDRRSKRDSSESEEEEEEHHHLAKRKAKSSESGKGIHRKSKSISDSESESISESESESDREHSSRRRKRSRSKEERGSKSRGRKSRKGRRSYSKSESESEMEERERESESEEERRRRRKRREKERREEERRRERERKKRKKREKRERDDEDDKRKQKKKGKKNGEKEKGKVGAVTDTWGKYGVIRESDMWNKRPEFSAWLAEVRQVNLETLPNWEEKKMFKEYMEDYNTATFPSKKYYNLDAYHKQQLEKQIKKGIKKVMQEERTVFDDEEQRRQELLRERQKAKDLEVEALKNAMRSGMAQAMKEQALLKEEMVLQYKLGCCCYTKEIRPRCCPVKNNCNIMMDLSVYLDCMQAGFVVHGIFGDGELRLACCYL
ncbi:hypothetical protein AKJ16_DCAP20077 [Drosera capensis]